MSKLLLRWNSSLARALQRGNFVGVLLYARSVAARQDANGVGGGRRRLSRKSLHAFERHSRLVDEVM